MKLFLVCSSLLLALWSAPARPADDPQTRSAAEEVRQLVIAFNQAYEKNDLEAYFSYYLAGATLWTNDEYSTVEAYRATWSEFVATGGAVRKNALSELEVRLSPAGDSAIATYRLDVETMQPDGSVSTDRSQETDVWFRTDTDWKIAHVHYAFQPLE